MSKIKIYHCEAHSDKLYENIQLDSIYFKTEQESREWFRSFKMKMEEYYKLDGRWREGSNTTEKGYVVEYSTNGEITLYCTVVEL